MHFITNTKKDILKAFIQQFLGKNLNKLGFLAKSFSAELVLEDNKE
jgi:hypothetical protein